ncbi:hypothetical protein JK169_00825 [Acetobacter persici]|uniref:hypothetical protein n=1 Tax=Acetobacter persici TaxID=1076596 RepID=UPI001BADCFB9|nr:hypothetical protein [Acetobacter persici]MBS0999568.1 hypothetical protein [Acetobacter persici]
MVFPDVSQKNRRRSCPCSDQEENQRNNFIYFNTTIGYHITKNFDASFMMNNVTNALPAHAGTVNLTRSYEAILGRSFPLQLGAYF